MSARRSLRAGALSAAVAIGALGIGACGSSSKSTSTAAGSGASGNSASASSGAQPGKGKPTFVLGDKNFAEEFVLGDLYQQALQAKGYHVVLKPNIGSTEITFKSLTSGQIDGYPEYDGTVLAAEANDTKNAANAQAEAASTKSWAAKHGLVYTNATPFSDSDALVVTKQFAQQNNLSSIGDLAKLGKKAVLAGPPENATRYPDGLPGIQRIYHAFPTFKPSSIGSFYTLLDTGKANVIMGFTTDPQLNSGKYKLLTDPKFIFGFQNVGLLAKASVVKAEGPAFLQTVNQVSALLTQKAIVSLNNAVQLNQQSPASVAKAFLKANNLL